VKRFEYFDAHQTQQILSRLDALVREINGIKDALRPKGQLTFEGSDEPTEPTLKVSRFDDATPSDKVTVRRFNREGPTLADLVCESFSTQEFSARQAYDAIVDRVTFTSRRPIDSVRAALERDSRFEKVGSGKYRKRVD